MRELYKTEISNQWKTLCEHPQWSSMWKSESPYFIPEWGIPNQFPYIKNVLNAEIEGIKEKHDVKELWLQIYGPYTGINTFHKDNDIDRNVLILYTNPRSFNYEIITSKENEVRDYWIDKWNNKINVDKFNNEFINAGNKIHIGNVGSVYSFGSTIHFFWNDSNSYRVSILFDINKEKQII